MSYRTLVGTKKSLVFPVMCFGGLKIPYASNVPDSNTPDTGTLGDYEVDDDEPYGIFDWDDSFTIQTILTPYDINGLGWGAADSNNPVSTTGILTSKKTMPGNQIKNYTVGSTTMNMASNNLESDVYLPLADKVGYEMSIFYNPYAQLSLINTADSTIETAMAAGVPPNTPSEYKIKFTVVADGSSDSLTSDKVITYDSEYAPRRWEDDKGYNSMTVGYELVTAVSGASGSNASVSNGNQLFVVGESIYVINPAIKKLGTVATTSSGGLSITYESDASASDITSAFQREIYRKARPEALYLIKNHHITSIFDAVSGDMSIYYDGKLVASKKHSAAPISSFAFSREDCYIGTGGTSAFTDVTKTRRQFMGELHELAIMGGKQNSFITLDTLMPNFRNTLLYLNFNESDIK